VADGAYDGVTAAELAARLALPRVVACESVTSTLDVAHALGAEDAPAGTLVLAERQTAGRGRGGKTWASAPGAGIWLTLIERPDDPDAVELLSIRVGLGAARALDRWTRTPVRLKWPNDLFVDGGKLGGILIEARWREDRLDWVAIGLGLNVVQPPDFPSAAALAPGADRVAVLADLLPALRAAAAACGSLDARELGEYARRDRARGRRSLEPAAGEIVGIDARGSLIVRTAAGDVECRTGSLILEEEVA
jgi:BirA family biotin operon repressor/biotin-[acetyl-CoA-carboxylase] ligase